MEVFTDGLREAIVLFCLREFHARFLLPFLPPAQCSPQAALKPQELSEP